MFNKISLNFMLLIIVFSAGALFGGEQIAFASEEKIQDPTQPKLANSTGFATKTPFHLQEWHLSSTLISPRRSLAIINGHVYQKGETFDGAEIMTIKAGAVELRYGNSSHWLHAAGAAVKKIHPSGGTLP